MGTGHFTLVHMETFLLINNYCGNDIDEARVILALQHKSKLNFDLFEKKIKFWVFCSTHEDLSIEVSISYYCRTYTHEARVISFLGAPT